MILGQGPRARGPRPAPDRFSSQGCATPELATRSWEGRRAGPLSAPRLRGSFVEHESLPHLRRPHGSQDLSVGRRFRALSNLVPLGHTLLPRARPPPPPCRDCRLPLQGVVADLIGCLGYLPLREIHASLKAVSHIVSISAPFLKWAASPYWF